jgi:uncharacterized membrane protein
MILNLRTPANGTRCAPRRVSIDEHIIYAVSFLVLMSFGVEEQFGFGAWLRRSGWYDRHLALRAWLS